MNEWSDASVPRVVCSASAPCLMFVQVPPGCTVVQGRRFQGQSIGARQVATNNTLDAFTLGLRCCARCSQDFPSAEAYFVCTGQGGCNESRDSVRYRPYGACECQLQPRAQRGQAALEATQLDNPQSFTAGVIVRDQMPFVPLTDVFRSSNGSMSSDNRSKSTG